MSEGGSAELQHSQVAELSSQGRVGAVPLPPRPQQQSQPCCGKGLGIQNHFSRLKRQRAALTWLWMRCEHRAVALPCSLQPSWDKPLGGQCAMDVRTALRGFPKVFPNSGAKRCLIPFSAPLSRLGLSTGCLVSWCLWPCAAGRRVWRASGMKEMSSLYESYLLGLLMG